MTKISHLLNGFLSKLHIGYALTAYPLATNNYDTQA